MHFHNKPFFLTNVDFKDLGEKIGKSPTYEGVKEIYNIFNDDKKIEISDIGDLKSDIFMANLYPLGRATTKDNYNDFVRSFLFEGDFEEWSIEYWMKRRDILINFLKNYFFNESNVEKFIFCLSISEWYTFEDLIKSALDYPDFKLAVIKGESNNNYYGYSKNSNYHIYCLYHPASTRFRYPDFQYIKSLRLK
jgi:hypothetical protein